MSPNRTLLRFFGGTDRCLGCPARITAEGIGNPEAGGSGCAVRNADFATIEGDYLSFVLAFQGPLAKGYSGRKCTNGYTYEDIYRRVRTCEGCPAAIWEDKQRSKGTPVFKGCQIVLMQQMAMNYIFDTTDSSILIVQEFHDLYQEVINSGHFYKKCSAGFDPGVLGFPIPAKPQLGTGHDLPAEES